MKNTCLRSIGSRLLPLVMGLTLTALPTTLRANFDYFIQNGEVAISGYTGPGGDVVIPQKIQNLPVTLIWFGAFNGCTSITSVKFPSTLEGFMYDNDGHPFVGCSSLITFKVDPQNPNLTAKNGILFTKDMSTLVCFPPGRCGDYKVPFGVTEIGIDAFHGCTELETVCLSDTVTEIANYAFQNCPNLYSVTIGTSVNYIGWNTFAGCYNLKSVIFQGNCPSFVGNSAFYDDWDAIAFITRGTTGWSYSVGGLTTQWRDPQEYDYYTKDGGIVIAGYNGKNKNVNIPERINGLPVTEISYLAFYGCANIETIKVPKTVTTVWGSELYGSPFTGCANLTAINVDPRNTAYCSYSGVLFDKSMTMLLFCPGGKQGSYTVPCVKNIAPDAFQDCDGLTCVYIPNGVTMIGQKAFYGCNRLTTVVIGKDLSLIGAGAFGGCYNLTTVYFKGNAPVWTFRTFDGDSKVTVYCQSGTTGWGSTFDGCPVVQR